MDLTKILTELLPFVVFVFSFIFIYIVLKILLKGSKKLAEKTVNRFDDMLVSLFEKKHFVISLYLALFIVTNQFYWDVTILGIEVPKLINIFAFILAADLILGIINVALDFYMIYIAPKTHTTLDDEILPLAKNLIAAVVYVFAFAFVLSSLGIDISPIVAGLGIGGLAVGLALQDTLSNFFSGVQILADRPVKAGDFVKIGDIEGYVVEMTWRTTKIRRLDNNLVIIPNKEIANSIIVNYERPDKPTVAILHLQVAYGSDLNHVEKVIWRVIEELKEKHPDIFRKEGGIVRPDELADFGITFVVILPIKHYTKQWSAKGLFFKRIYEEFKREGIRIPYPTHTVYLVKE